MCIRDRHYVEPLCSTSSELIINRLNCSTLASANDDLKAPGCILLYLVLASVSQSTDAEVILFPQYSWDAHDTFPT